MRLHVFLLLFLVTTDKTLALSRQLCGGNVTLDQESTGRISLALPGLFIDTSAPNPVSQQTLAPSVCTLTIHIPQGRTVLLKLEWLDSGSSISVRCVWDKESQVLERGQTAVLSYCDRNKAAITWTGAGPSSKAAQLVYYVQEDERNSSEGRPTRRPDQDLVHWSQTGTSFTSTAPVGQELVRVTDGGRGHLYEGLEPQSVPSASSSRDQGLLHPTSPQQGLPVAGGTDRETLPLPEEKPNNGADTSAAAHLTDIPMTAREGTHPYFQRALSTDTANTSNEMAQTALTDVAASTDTQKYTSKLKDKHVATQTDQSVSSSSTLLLTELSSRTTWESDTVLNPRGRAASGTPGHKHFWRSQRSTDTLNSHLTAATTLGPSEASTKSPQHDSSSADTDTEPTSSSLSSLSQGSSKTHSSTTHVAELNPAVGTRPAAPVHPNISQSDSFVSSASDVTAQTAPFQFSANSENTEALQTPASTSPSHTISPQGTESVTHSPHMSSTFTQTSDKDKQTSTGSAQTHFSSVDVTTRAISSRPDVTTVDERTPGFTGSVSTPRAPPSSDVVQNSSATGTTRETSTLRPTHTLLRDGSPTDSSTSVPLLSSGTSINSFTPSYMLQTHTLFLDNSHDTISASSVIQPTMQTATVDHKTTLASSQTLHTPQTQRPLQTSTEISATRTQAHSTITTPTTHSSVFSLTTIKSENGDGEVEGEKEDKIWQWSPSSTTTNTPTSGQPKRSLPGTTPNPSQKEHLTLTPSVLTSAWSSTKSPMFYIVPDRPAAIRVESIELLLQIVVEESRSAFTDGLEEDTIAWLEPYLQKAPGFSRLLGVWSSGHAVQSLVEFKTSRALSWLSVSGPTSLLERTGLAQAVREGRTFRSSKITNITLGGLQDDVCHWLLQCPSGYKCVSPPVTANYSCSSVCRFDYCHHHGICTHHPGQLPVCRCLVGDDFWYMGQRCDMRMTRARLVGACLAILIVMVTVIGVLAFVAVRRYRAMLIQAKVDQTRSSYRRFNHFDELSGRFWLRSWAGSADSLDNPAFTRSDELLHLRALDRPCCYHDDTLSLASTCPSHGTHINTIYPHSSQYGWRGSEMSMGDGVLDSGKASDLSVCSWPVEPIHWTPFPLLQQLASRRTPTVRVSRPRSYCEGMELVDLGKSWTA